MDVSSSDTVASGRVLTTSKLSSFNELTLDQKEFTAKMIMNEVEKYAKEHNVSPEVAYEFYQRGMLGSDRTIG